MRRAVGGGRYQSRAGWTDRPSSTASGTLIATATLVLALSACTTTPSGPASSVAQPSELADGYSQPLEGRVGDAVRGRAIVVDRTRGLCLLCHSGPFPDAPQQGSLAPSLAGAGDRLSRAQLRQRMADSRSINPESIMPSFHRSDHLQQVADSLKGKPILDAQEVEDVVEFLATLRKPVVIDLIPAGLGP